MPHWIQTWRNVSKVDQIRIFFIALMQIAFVGAFFIALHEQDWLTMFVSVVALGVVWLPVFLEHRIRVLRFPLEFSFLLNIFIYSSLFLGEMQGFYTRFWWWDVVLHMSSGIALGFIGFLILFSLYKSRRVSMDPALLAFFSFSFALALGVLWEIFEFSMDSAFGFNMQKSGLVDTMWDLIVNTIGASIASLSGYFYLRYAWRGMGIFEHYLNTFLSKTSRYLS